MSAEEGIVIGELNRLAPELDVALHAARPWRASARAGAIYTSRRIEDPRSTNKTVL